MEIEGNIQANGGDGFSALAAGGSGGTIYINSTFTFASFGSVTANGGNGGSGESGGGGGGRIAISYLTGTLDGVYEARGGVGGVGGVGRIGVGGPGTIYCENRGTNYHNLTLGNGETSACITTIANQSAVPGCVAWLVGISTGFQLDEVNIDTGAGLIIDPAPPTGSTAISFIHFINIFCS